MMVRAGSSGVRFNLLLTENLLSLQPQLERFGGVNAAADQTGKECRYQ
jgi:hypothetical protein